MKQAIENQQENQPSQQSAKHRIFPRKMRTRDLDTGGRHWLGGDPYATAFFNALSAVFPRGEAFMIESLRAWQDKVPGSWPTMSKTLSSKKLRTAANMPA